MNKEQPPKKIWLQHEEDDHPECDTYFGEGMTWCEDKINERDIGYVREDIVQEMTDALIEAREAIQYWIEMTDCGCDEYHICGLPKRQRQLVDIEFALKKAGVS